MSKKQTTNNVSIRESIAELRKQRDAVEKTRVPETASQEAEKMARESASKAESTNDRILQLHENAAVRDEIRIERKAFYEQNSGTESWVVHKRNVYIGGRFASVYIHTRELFPDGLNVIGRGLFRIESVAYFANGERRALGNAFYHVRRNGDLLQCVDSKGNRLPLVELDKRDDSKRRVVALLTRGNIDMRDPEHDKAYARFLESRSAKIESAVKLVADDDVSVDEIALLLKAELESEEHANE